MYELLFETSFPILVGIALTVMALGLAIIHWYFKIKFFTRISILYSGSVVLITALTRVAIEIDIFWLRYIFIPLVTLAIGLGSLVVLLRYFFQPLFEFSKYTKRILQGEDIHQEMTEKYFDEIGETATAINLQLKNYAAEQSKISEYNTKISSNTGWLNTMVENLAAALAQQSSAINQTTTTIQELNFTGEQTTDKAKMVVNSAEHSSEITDTGKKSLDEILAEMQMIREKVEKIATQILSLSVHTQKIGNIISKVNDLAEQTNLLALNASIEAAKAGEEGAGFSVVAQEIRRLADQSQVAVVEIEDILTEIQTATNTSVMTTEEGTKGVDIGVAKIEQFAELVDQVLVTLQENKTYAADILNSANQQSIGITQISQAITNINDVMMQISSIAEDSQRISSELQSIVEDKVIKA
jgi:methyl-accepting chemotaxis protein